MGEEFKREAAAPQQETINMIEKMLQGWNINPPDVKDKEFGGTK